MKATTSHVRGLDPPSHPGVEEVTQALARWLDDHAYESWDPYDGLTSPFLGSVRRHRQLARVCLQLVKRSPLNLRPALRIRRRLYTQSLSDLASASFVRQRSDAGKHPRAQADRGHIERGERFLQMLRARKLEGYAGACWGMDLPYVSRFVVATPRTPNLFQTVNAAAAFVDAFEITARGEHLDTALSVLEFIRHDLGSVDDTRELLTWRYYPGQDAVVYNVNALLSNLLLRLVRHTGRRDLELDSRRTMNAVLQAQNTDGSWYYARGAHGRWIDGFHTAYILESLMSYAEVTDDRRAAQALDHGVRFFRQRLLETSGLPRYTPSSLHPIEVQNCAEAIRLLSRLAKRDPAWLELASGAFEQTCRQLLVWSGPPRAPRAWLRQQRGRWLRIALPTVRWGVAPMLLALAHLQHARVMHSELHDA